MEKQVKISLIAAGTLVLVVFLVLYVYTNSQSQQTISTSGAYSLEVMPDNVVIYFNIETTSKTLEEAKDENARISDDLITSLVKQGLERKQIQTQSYNIYPDTEWVYNRLVDKGYKVSHSLKVVLPADSTDIGTIVDKGVDAGAMVSYINFELTTESENKYKAEAINLASQDARNKAEAMATGLGQRVGKVISISDSNADYSPWRAYDMASSEIAVKEAVTNISPSEQTISARVSVVFSIK